MSYSLSQQPACNEPYIGPSLAQSCPGSQFLVFMTLLDMFVRSKRQVSRLCERVRPTESADYFYDFIVVGVQSARASSPAVQPCSSGGRASI
ncbi:unnamed protein product [Trichogramma brassicae]|uniref:Uncharacterized protein n=1 Tax=Trichogramma brassicae TaxID=86971 RepID=A0A6H5IXS0_9HYME|nr:unnamed protein product [Trichogramma brassicae]